ncbi:UNVERIFIED_CONTAM: hypothetical protein Sangu_2510600 [Sesamum angustifolium]|uniref:Tf2-1-like SH3-like domain-containing protein n=1 Tax=Sesamum angustifolium TaxID=2727405 RepID=A0AAW2JP65_9LAMI
MKKQADKERSEREFNVGDSVFVKLQPYKQLSLKAHSYHRLSPKIFGPFQVIQRIGKVAYRLDLSPHTKIHSTFHVSQLKKCHGESIAPRRLLVMLTPHGHLVLEPEAILDRRIILFHNRPLTQILVKWFNTPTEDSIWENYYEFM